MTAGQEKHCTASYIDCLSGTVLFKGYQVGSLGIVERELLLRSCPDVLQKVSSFFVNFVIITYLTQYATDWTEPVPDTLKLALLVEMCTLLFE